MTTLPITEVEKPDTDLPQAFSVNFWADRLDLHPITLRRKIAAGEISAIRAGDRVLIEPAAVRDWLDRSTVRHRGSRNYQSQNEEKPSTHRGRRKAS
jgi:excisionase family DNA binding protein